jgi:signal transduction histidine kinase
MTAFAGFTLLVAIVFGFYAIVFMYSIEDAFFDDMLAEEVTAQLAAQRDTGRWATPGHAWMTVHADPSSFPADLAAPFTQEPWRSEFPGRDGRHYHVAAIVPPAPAASAWLVAEVGAELFVRPVRNQVLALLAGTGALLVAVALVVGYRLARRTTGPLSRLAERIDGMSPGQLPRDFARDWPNDEVGVLARGLESLAGRIDAFVAREQSFTRDASHELRTPLAVMLGAAERLATEPALSDAGRQYVAHVRQSVRQLEQTVTALLALAREEHADGDDARTLALPALERVIVEQSPLLDADDMDVVVDVPSDVSAALPGAALHILLSNLVGNAFAHADGGDVRIDVADGRLRIANRGDAADPAGRWQRQQLFDKREGSGGEGLGLAIVRRLCDRYRVDLRIDDAGGEVCVSIPVDDG